MAVGVDPSAWAVETKGGMPYRTLGRTGEKVSLVGLGGCHLGKQADERESVIYVVRGRTRMRWGEQLEFMAEAGPGDFIYIPPFVPHQEINASKDEVLSCMVAHSGQEPIVVNLDIEPVEPLQEVYWVDPIHTHP